ncbi:MAG: hypothetical protein M1816_006907 [Peltula sp. TS41687]|nr:MAG: hypothetical protein M1816_006907 [Peltula sp. TS41687]
MATWNRRKDDGNDGWGEDAPPVARSELEKVQSAYKPTKVNMEELRRNHEPSRFSGRQENPSSERDDVVKGGYQPVGKVDIAAIRRQAQAGSTRDDAPAPVKGAYEPVGKVDIAAIRARVQPPSSAAAGQSKGIPPSNDRQEESRQLPDRTASSAQSERLTSLPRPKVGNKFGSSTTHFTGTKAPTPVGYGLGSKPAPSAPPVGTASRTFADEGGKTPAQIWAEKKARERGLSGAGDTVPPATSPLTSQKSGGEWKSGYGGKKWAPVKTTTTGGSASDSVEQQLTGPDHEDRQEEPPRSPVGGVGALRDRFKGNAPMGAPSVSKSPTNDYSAPSPPPLDKSLKPNAGARPGVGIPHPGLPTRPSNPYEEEEPEEEEEKEEKEAQPVRMPTPPAVPRSPTPPTPPAMRSSSPIRVAMPVSRSKEPELSAPAERFLAPSLPTESIAKVAPREEDLTDEPAGHDPARAAGEAAATATFGAEAAQTADPGANIEGKKALIQYDYEKAEGNEIDLVEGEYVANIEMVDEDWWMGQNSKGETGLFPSNYVELVDEQHEEHAPAVQKAAEQAHPPPPAAPEQTQHSAPANQGPTATAVYDYEAAESNELSFAEGDIITGIEFPDDDWWFGHLDHKEGLFPANYVQLNE